MEGKKLYLLEFSFHDKIKRGEKKGKQEKIRKKC
jgi:hypothetical protein